jgi:hypothetical protein
MQAFARIAIVFVCAVLMMPALTYAQASLAGVVRDTSGAVLPGVTVEASSPVLIERVRTAVSDASGQYRIENLRPGVYELTFTLTGFNTVKREGVELVGSATTTASAELRVGSLEETITVTGAAPLVDIQNTTQQRVLDKQVLDAIPTGRSDRTLALLIPAVSIPTTGTLSQDVGGTVYQQNQAMSVHGSRANNTRIMYAGVSTGVASGGGGGANSNLPVNMAAFQEVVINTAAVSAESTFGGVAVNFIPRDGGNTFSGSAFISFANESMQADNFTDALRGAGLAAPTALKRMWDVNPGFGGPVMKDKLWFYGTLKSLRSEAYPGGAVSNRNGNNASAWTYVPAEGTRPYNSTAVRDAQARLTWQVTPGNKIGFMHQEGWDCFCPQDVAANRAPEAGQYREHPKLRAMIADWTWPLTNRVLIEASAIRRWEDTAVTAPADRDLSLVSVTEQSLGNLVYRGMSPATYRSTWHRTVYARGAVSYVTGARALKVGFNSGVASDTSWRPGGDGARPAYEYRFNNGVPNLITLYGTPYREVFLEGEHGAFVQDRWTIRRLTASYGVRYDYYKNSFPPQTLGPVVLQPTRNMSFPRTAGVSWHDLSPRLGANYDLSGSGRTALKVSLNRYLQGMTADPLYGHNLNPLTLVAVSTTRTWNDANRNFTPDCNLVAPAANGECGPLANANFGTPRPGAAYNPDTMSGFGIRPYDWEFSAGVQHELVPRLSADVAYFRRWFGNFFVNDNRAVAPSDFAAFSLAVPNTDPRLPTAGSTLSNLFDLNPTSVGQVDNYVTFASDYGTQTEHWNGVDVGINARLANGVIVQGGTSTGRTTRNTCDIRAKVPETAPTNPYCDSGSPWLTQIKFLAVYTVPRADVQVSGTVQSIPGPPVQANFPAPNALVAPSLGRSLSGNAQNVTVSLIDPLSMVGDRIHQVDMRVGKILRWGGVRTTMSLDVYNVFNSNAILGVNSAFGGATPWLAPQAILQGRLFKLAAQLDF